MSVQMMLAFVAGLWVGASLGVFAGVWLRSLKEEGR